MEDPAAGTAEKALCQSDQVHHYWFGGVLCYGNGAGGTVADLAGTGLEPGIRRNDGRSTFVGGTLLVTRSFAVPDEEESKLMKSVGLDPNDYAVILSNEDTLWLMHYKTRHELMIKPNRMVKS